MKQCKSCELIRRRERGEAPLWDNIQRTRYWDLAHCFNTVLPGWLVLIARQHVESIDQLSEAEAAELGRVLRTASLALREVTGCIKTYVIQFAEHPDHPHVHFHLIPRMQDQPEDRRSMQVFEYMRRPAGEWVTEAHMNQIAAQIQRALSRPR